MLVTRCQGAHDATCRDDAQPRPDVDSADVPVRGTHDHVDGQTDGADCADVHQCTALKGAFRVSAGDLARQRRCIEQLRERWPNFVERRHVHLRSHAVGQTPAERIAENILFDLFTNVLDWAPDQVRWQESRIDLLLTRLGVKHLIVEVKRPGSLDGPGGIARAFQQACGYAEQHNVRTVAVSDGCLLDVRDRSACGFSSRLRIHLSDSTPPEELWWVSTRGIYRTPPSLPVEEAEPPSSDGEELLHPKYALPARCFAFVGQPTRTSTWKLPYLRLDGSIDERRLPKAIQAVLRDYRGEQVRLPEDQVPDVLVRLAKAATRLGRMPHQDVTPAEIYSALEETLIQFGRQGELNAGAG